MALDIKARLGLGLQLDGHQAALHLGVSIAEGLST